MVDRQEVVQIAGVTAAQPTAEWVIARARSRFLAGERLEMGVLAGDAGVNRATLFRWFGGRDRFLGEVVWSITAPTLDALAAGAAGTGGERVANLMGDFAEVANGTEPFASFVRAEPQRALRVMTTRGGGVQQRIADRIALVIDEEVRAGRLDPPLPVSDLAFLLVRIAETFVYSNIITGDQPDAGKVRLASAALLGIPATAAFPTSSRRAQ